MAATFASSAPRVRRHRHTSSGGGSRHRAAAARGVDDARPNLCSPPVRPPAVCAAQPTWSRCRLRRGRCARRRWTRSPRSTTQTSSRPPPRRVRASATFSSALSPTTRIGCAAHRRHPPAPATPPLPACVQHRFLRGGAVGSPCACVRRRSRRMARAGAGDCRRGALSKSRAAAEGRGRRRRSADRTMRALRTTRHTPTLHASVVTIVNKKENGPLPSLCCVVVPFAGRALEASETPSRGARCLDFGSVVVDEVCLHLT